jgi:BirA family biotin operon repressor/biotin-[acetyl-CoA-carboxylase] ligase
VISSRIVRLEALDVVTSTLDIARENILSGRVAFNQLGQAPCDGVLAQMQTQGRGQRGRMWWAEPGESLLATYYFRRGLTDPQHAPQIGLLAGVAVASALRAHLLDIAGKAQESDRYAALRLINRIGLKWPNDLLLGQRKLGGLLIEMVRAPDGDWVALIGVGINMLSHSLPGELAQTATSLARENVTGADIRDFAEQIATALQRVADRRRTEGFDAILAHWRELDRSYGLRYRATLDGHEVEATAVGVDDVGALQLRLRDGNLLTVRSATSIREIPG